MRIFRSQDTNALLTALSQQLRTPLKDPLKKECVVVQGRGMEQWLSHRLSDTLGIWAHAEFPFPRALVERVLGHLGDDNPESLLAYQPERLQWVIADLLEQDLSKGPNNNLDTLLSDYLCADDQQSRREGRLLGLADTLASVFDDYAIRRPEMVLKWESEGPEQAPPEARWQAKLWCDIVERLGPHHMVHRIQQGLQTLRTPGLSLPSDLPERISIFGLSSLPKIYMQFLGALAEHIDIDLYLMTPTSQHWTEIRSAGEILQLSIKEGQTPAALHLEEGHPLLATLGTLGRDFARILNETLPNPQEIELYKEPEPHSLLTQLQADIFHLIHRGPSPSQEAPLVNTPVDRSIQVHSCASELREVEVLRDQILDLLEHSDIRPQEIVVMAPDIDQYAPLIDAVFREPLLNGERLPYRISDRSLSKRGAADALRAFSALLGMLDGRYTSNEVVSLLQFSSIRDRFGIVEDDVPELTEWVRQSGIRWGIDASHRSEEGQAPHPEQTWFFGLDRLLLGFCCPSEPGDVYWKRAPVEGVDDSAGEALGAFADFITCLANLQKATNETHRVEHWIQLLLSALTDFISSDERNSSEHTLMRSLLLRIGAAAASGGFEGEVSLQEFREVFGKRLGLESRSNLFDHGGITFCQMIPMRSVPYRVIALMGLSEGRFPREDKRPSFDLQKHNRRVGDRSVRDDDRYLFLEALLSARDNLLLSFVGQGIRDGETKPPSAALAALTETLRETFGEDTTAAVWTEHPLQPHDARYFVPSSQAQPLPRSYSAEHLAAARASKETPEAPFPLLTTPVQAPEIEVVGVDQFIDTLLQPTASFLQSRAGVKWRRLPDMLEEQITIVQNSLEAHTLGTLGEKLLESGVSAEDLLTIFSAHGVIPGGRLGTLQTKAIVDKLTRLESRLKEARTDANRREERFEIQLDAFRLVGTVGELWGQRRVIPLLGKANPKRLLRAWVKQLCLQSANKEHVDESVLVGPDESYRLRKPEDPKAVLQSLANVFLASREEPIPFEVGAAFAFASRVEADNKRTPESWKEARESLENSYSPHAPRQAAFRGIAIVDIESKSGHDFATTSETVFRALIQCREEYP